MLGGPVWSARGEEKDSWVLGSLTEPPRRPEGAMVPGRGGRRFGAGRGVHRHQRIDEEVIGSGPGQLTPGEPEAWNSM